MRGAPRVKQRAAAALAVGLEHVVNRRVEPGSRQGGDDEASFPIVVRPGGQMLEGTAAAGAKMRTDRRGARAGLAAATLWEAAPVGMTRPTCGRRPAAVARSAVRDLPCERDVADKEAAPTERS